MVRWNSGTLFDNDAQPGKDNRRPEAMRFPSTSRNRPTDGSLTSRENSFRRSPTNVLECAMDLDDARSDQVSRVKEEIAAGRYHVTSSKLAERLLQIARSDFR